MMRNVCLVVMVGLLLSLTAACSGIPSAEGDANRDGIHPQPYSDPDGDGLQTYQETAWGTDPTVETSFIELIGIDAAKSVTMRVSHPYAVREGSPSELDLAELNSTIYQYVNPDTWVIEDNGTPDDPDDDHLTMDVLLFPGAEEGITPMPVDAWPIEPGLYPPEVRAYLESHPEDVSAISDEIKDTMLRIVNGTGGGYHTQAASDVEAVQRILDWNQAHIRQIFGTGAYWAENRTQFLPDTWESQGDGTEGDPIPGYGDLTRFTAPALFDRRVSRACITRATLLTAELRAVGIPVKIAHHVSSRCDPDAPGCAQLEFSSHFQNLVYMGFTWTLRDFEVADQVRAGPYAHYVLTDGFRDNSDAIFTPWILTSDRGIGTWSDLFKPLEPGSD